MRWWGWWAAGVIGLAAVLGLALALGPSGRTAAPAAGSSSSDSHLNNSFTTSAIDSCVRPLVAAGAGGIPAYALDGTLLASTVRTGHEPGTHPRCADGELRILRLTAVTVDGGPAYLRRGGCQTPCVVRQPTVLVRAADLARPIVPLPAAVLAGDGAPAPGCTRPITSTPARAGSALGRMYYKTPGEIGATRRRTAVAGAGALWSNYGDPGRRFRSASGVHSDYTYLLWNLPRRESGGPLPGGGIARAPIADGEQLELCSPARLTLPSFDVDGASNGSVVFGYARARDTSGAPIYGWLLLGYRYGDRRFKDTIAPA
jgi:hypothetical protein